MTVKTPADFEDSVVFWKDTAKMLEAELSALKAENERLRGMNTFLTEATQKQKKLRGGWD